MYLIILFAGQCGDSHVCLLGPGAEDGPGGPHYPQGASRCLAEGEKYTLNIMTCLVKKLFKVDTILEFSQNQQTKYFAILLTGSVKY